MTKALPEPLTTLVPMNAMFSSSSEFSVSSRWTACFSTGSDSPVNAAWATNRSLAFRIRQSAGIMSPADSSTTSPGTSSASGTSIWCEPESCTGAPNNRLALPAAGASAFTRSTVAVFCTIAFSASAARFDRNS
ncbi:hypothetical protein D3C85_608920 [compost metagenome]